MATIIHYLNCMHASGKGMEAESPLTKSSCIRLMNEVWEYVTPTLRGIPTTKLLYDGAVSYAGAKGIDLCLQCLDIHEDTIRRPEFNQLLSFLSEALANNRPVAFLNLDNGDEKLLDSWHWVTMVGLEYEEDGSLAMADILDEGVVKKVDLALWSRTTKLGGGFVRFGCQ